MSKEDKIDRDTPMKTAPLKKGKYYVSCPICDAQILPQGRYCKFCGQRLDFGETIYDN